MTDNFMIIRVFVFAIILVLLGGCVYKNDGAIQNEIAKRFNANNQLGNVTCIVTDGSATLSGNVEEDASRFTAEAIAWESGAKNVTNNISVVPQFTDDLRAGETETKDIVENEPPSLNDEAQKIAEEFWKKTLTKCDDTYYFKVQYLPYSEDYIAFQGEPVIYAQGTTFQPKELTPAEKLNKVDPFPVEWSGDVKLSYSVKRTRKSEKIYGGSDGTWTEWEDGEHTQRISLSKAKGQWNLNNPEIILNHHWNVAPVRCSEINGAPKPQSQMTLKQTSDISDSYGRVGNVIYNKKTMIVFTKPAEFFKDSGKLSFDGLKYDQQSGLPSGLKFVNGHSLTDADYERLK